MEQMDGAVKHMSDLIQDQYKDWKDTKVILSGGTGSGKTYFVINILIPYYIGMRKNVLYLCNRTKLEKQIKPELENFSTVHVMTYQRLQKKIRKQRKISRYDLIIADECHYFWTDAKYNSYTDIAYQYIMRQKGNVTVLMSATADSFFRELRTQRQVLDKYIFMIPKSYYYIEKVYTYTKPELQDIIDYILSQDDEEKIMVFVNSIQRLEEMHKIYGIDADYMCSNNQKCNFSNSTAIENNSFKKRILFTTKVLDNGIDIKDDNVKHIISELFDVDCTLQAIGRKRPIDCLDTCNLYFCKYDGRAVNNFSSADKKQLMPAVQYLTDKDKFIKELGNLNIDERKLVRENKIFYYDFMDGKLKINEMALKKYQMDELLARKMKESSYEEVLFEMLGEELSKKKSMLDIYVQKRDIFLDYLKEIEDQKLFREQQTELKMRFKDILGLHDRTMGINTLNGKLQDCQYPYKIISCKDRSRQSETYNKRYWMIQKI